MMTASPTLTTARLLARSMPTVDALVRRYRPMSRLGLADRAVALLDGGYSLDHLEQGRDDARAELTAREGTPNAVRYAERLAVYELTLELAERAERQAAGA